MCEKNGATVKIKERKQMKEGGFDFMKSTKKRLSSLIICLAILAAAASNFFSEKLVTRAANDVTPSTKEYEVELYQTGIFLKREWMFREEKLYILPIQ